uniref:Uncharacterized protein n=1 Tax=viral metagenome TaxID=1070528 RepID=A0A6M3LM26_9ZZZZ
MPDVKNSSGDSDRQSDVAKEITVKVGEEEQTFNADQIAQMIVEKKSVTEMGQKAAPILKALEKYNTDAETLLGQTEEAFAVIAQMQDAGLIDEKGNIIKKTEVKVIEPFKALAPVVGADKTAEIVLKALGPKIEDVVKRLATLEQDQTATFRDITATKVMTRYPNFKEDDVHRLFARSSQRPEKTMWQHAEDMNAEKGNFSKEQRQAYAKEFGINLDEFDRNKLIEQDPEGGASAMYKGKKFSFRKGPKGRDTKDTITPREATIAFMNKQLGGGS